MHNIEIILGLLLVVAILAVVAERLIVPYPILLVLGGLFLGFIPGLPKVEIDPELVFLVFLPPLVTSAAWYIPVSRRLRESDPYPPWQDVLLIGWTGMRGVLSLAAALALPLTTNNEISFPGRDLIIFLTFCVILVTLVLQGLTLPLLIRYLKVTEDIDTEREEMEARLRTAEAAMARLQELTAQDNVLAESEMVEWLRTQYKDRIRRFSACCDAMDNGSYEQLAAFEHLQHEVLAAERKILSKLLKQGVINDKLLLRIERDLDLDEVRLGR